MTRRWFLFPLILMGGFLLGADAPPAPPAGPFAAFTRDWRDDPAWNNSKAQVAVYDVVSTINGVERRYEARVTINQEWADPVTKTRAADGKTQGMRPVFKQLVREDVPLDHDTLHISTATYVGLADLKSLKIDMSWQDSRGTTFKQYVNHKGTLTWEQFSYLPGEGHKNGDYAPPPEFVYQNALSMTLRGFPFADPHEVQLLELPDQALNGWTQTQPRPVLVVYHGPATLDLPIGKVEAHAVSVSSTQPSAKPESAAISDERYWFANDAGAPWLHVMVRYERAAPFKTLWKLKSLSSKSE